MNGCCWAGSLGIWAWWRLILIQTKRFVIRSLNICLFAKLVRIIRKYSPDYVFTPMIHPWHNLVISLLPRKIKIIKVIHDVAPHLGESNLFSMLMNKADIFFSDRLVVLSQHSRKELEKAGIKKNICIIPHANFSYYSKYNDLATERKIYNKVGFLEGLINIRDWMSCLSHGVW